MRSLIGRFLLEIGLGLEPTVPSDVIQPNSSISEDSPDEQPAMAARRILLAARHGHPESLGSTLEAFDSSKEGRRRGERAVQHVTLRVVELLPLWASAELATEEEIRESSIPEGALQILSVVLPDATGVGLGADVGHHVDGVAAQD